MKKISFLAICLFTAMLVSCGGSVSSKSESGELKTEDVQSSDKGTGNDFLKNYEDFVNSEVTRLQNSPKSAEVIAESVKAAESFLQKHGDPNLISMTPETQKKFNELREKYNDALAQVFEEEPTKK